jgi:hypothetical protein
MKKKFLITFILFSMLIINGYTQQPDNWKWMNPTPQGNSLFAMDFTDNNTGYSAGAFGTVIKTTRRRRPVDTAEFRDKHQIAEYRFRK